MQHHYIGNMATPKQRDMFKRALVLVEREDRGTLLTTHNYADTDGIGSIYALKRYLDRIHPNADCAVVLGHISTPALPLIETLKIEHVPWQDIRDNDGRPLIVLDTCSKTLLNGAIERGHSVLLNIDHHEPNGVGIKPQFAIVNEAAMSAAELIASLIPTKYINSDVALALAVGMAGDSERLNHATSHSLDIFSKLMACSGRRKPEIDALAYPREDPRTVLKLFKEMRKMLYVGLYKETTIAIAKTSLDIPAILAERLRSHGFAVSVVIKPVAEGMHNLSIRVFFRDAYEKRIYASEIAREAALRKGKGIECGGGHIDKAGAVVNGTIKEIVEAVLASIKTVIDRGMVVPQPSVPPSVTASTRVNQPEPL